MRIPAATYLSYPKPDSRILPSGSTVVGFERHEDTLAWWEPPCYTQKAYFKADAYWEEKHFKEAFLAKYPKVPPHPARTNITPEFLRDYEQFIATLGIYLTRAGIHSRQLQWEAQAVAAAAATQEAGTLPPSQIPFTQLTMVLPVNEILTDGFLAAWTSRPIAAVHYMGAYQFDFSPAFWVDTDDMGHAGSSHMLTLWGPDAGTSSGTGIGGIDGWQGGGWQTPDTVSDTDAWAGGGWGTGGWGTTWAHGWGGGPRPRPQSSRRYVRGGRRSMGAFFRPRLRRSRRRPIL
ncbi:hypothetical protein C8R43DRAFT_946133 [Mycena crocata]|nr:hypothetical protein C8R43DRAFT_946133 [Mycena crocata]